MSSEITALKLCVLMFWASKGGIAGGASQYALAPGKPPHRYQRKLHRLLGFHDFEKRFMQIRVPGNRNHDLDRTELRLNVIPPHEAILAEVEASLREAQGSVEALELKLREWEVGPDLETERYTNHPVTQVAGPPVRPIII